MNWYNLRDHKSVHAEESVIHTFFEYVWFQTQSRDVHVKVEIPSLTHGSTWTAQQQHVSTLHLNWVGTQVMPEHSLYPTTRKETEYTQKGIYMVTYSMKYWNSNCRFFTPLAFRVWIPWSLDEVINKAKLKWWPCLYIIYPLLCRDSVRVKTRQCCFQAFCIQHQTM